MQRIIVTGGSGFIGTNLVEWFLCKGFEVHNLDISKPKNTNHQRYWKKVDICDLDKLKRVFEDLKPNYVVHLAARTDLLGSTLEDYQVNIKGVNNIIEICDFNSNIKRVIFASSMLVHEVGSSFLNSSEYSPNTVYGQSKVVGEKIVYENQHRLTNFCIIRPTSIWGEWFGEPYRRFFDLIISQKFFDLGDKASTKTYGYVGNSVFQIERLLFADDLDVKNKIFYIGDFPPLNISEWANEITTKLELPAPRKLPFMFFRCAAILGDSLKMVGINFPITSFRLRNMTTDNVIDLSETNALCGETPFSKADAIIRTIKWIRNNYET